MQGQRGIGSFTETIDINPGTTSSAAVRPQICWNNVQNAGDSRSPVTYVNPAGQERQTVSRLSFRGPSSSIVQNEGNWDEQKAEHIWSSSSSSFARNSPSFGGQHYELTNNLPANNVNSNPMIMQGSSRNDATQNVNLNSDNVACGTDNCNPNLFKANATEIERMQSASGPDPSLHHYGCSGYLVEENNGRLDFPMEGRRSTRKRKSPEVFVGESSSSGGRRSLQHGEINPWPTLLADGSGSSLSISLPSEQLNPSNNVQTRGFASSTLQNSSFAGNAENSCRNLRMRMDPSSQPESGRLHMYSSGSAGRPSSSLSSQQSVRTSSVNSLDWTHSEQETTISHDQPGVIHIPPLPGVVQLPRWNSVSSSNPSSSSGPVVSGNRDALPEESNLRRSGRNLSSHPRILSSTGTRNLVPCPTNRSLVIGNSTTPRVASASGSGTSSAVPSSVAWVPPAHPPSQYPRRLSEYVRRSLFSPAGPESGGQGSSHSPPLSGPSSHEMLFPSGAANQDTNQSNVRPTPRTGRQGDGVLAIPYPFRNSAGEARRGRLVSEIRSVLDLMRRGEGGVRLEDVMILDQSGLFNIADIHDRHRDMRLDVDNMSYEELLALEERIGNVNTGLTEETISSRLKLMKFFQLCDDQEDVEPCCICQEEYQDGEDLGRLDCGHDFHRDCIKQWLTHKNLCPICKTTGLAT